MTDEIDRLLGEQEGGEREEAAPPEETEAVLPSKRFGSPPGHAAGPAALAAAPQKRESVTPEAARGGEPAAMGAGKTAEEQTGIEYTLELSQKEPETEPARVLAVWRSAAKDADRDRGEPLTPGTARAAGRECGHRSGQALASTSLQSKQRWTRDEIKTIGALYRPREASIFQAALASGAAAELQALKNARQASAAALHDRLRRAGTAAGYRARPEAAMEHPAPARDAGWPSLDELDRTFQRDARRYDRGFELY